IEIGLCMNNELNTPRLTALTSTASAALKSAMREMKRKTVRYIPNAAKSDTHRMGQATTSQGETASASLSDARRSATESRNTSGNASKSTATAIDIFVTRGSRVTRCA